MCHRNGFGVEKNATKAVFWYQKAADQGNDQARYSLEEMNENEFGFEEDETGNSITMIHKKIQNVVPTIAFR